MEASSNLGQTASAGPENIKAWRSDAAPPSARGHTGRVLRCRMLLREIYFSESPGIDRAAGKAVGRAEP